MVWAFSNVIQNWMRNRNTVDFLAVWEELHNPDFNRVQFEAVRSEAGLNRFVMTPTKWIEQTNAIGIVSKAGRYGGGTYAHNYKDFYYYGCKHRNMTRGHKCDYKKQVHEEMLDASVAEVISNPKFSDLIRNKINMEVDTSALDQEIENYKIQLRKLYHNKDTILSDMDSLDYEDKHYQRRKTDLENHLYKTYDKIDDAYKKEAEIVTKEFVKRNDNYNSIVGGVIQYSNFDALFQYDFDGNFIKKWDSVKSAVEFFGCNGNRFNMAIKDKRSALGCFWSKTYYEKLDVSTFRKSNHQEVWCYYKNGEIYKKYDNATDAQKDLKLTKASINDAISHRKCLKGFYFISDILRSDDIIKQNNLIYNLSDNSISRYSNGKLIQTYPSIKQAARETNSTF